MRATLIGRLIIIMLLLLGGAFALPALDSPASTVMADEGKDKNAQDDDADDSDDEGDDNAGKKDKDDKKNKDNGKDKDNATVITAGEAYIVEAACEFDADADTTTCAFTAIAPDGAKKVVEFDLPEEFVCAEVVGGEYKYVDPDPNTDVTGYQSKGNTDEITLVLDGEVTIGGSATYWMKAANAVFPVTGPGLDCGSAGAASFELQTTPEATATVTTGELVVLIYTCASVPEDTTDYDWFGACDDQGGVHELALAPVSEVAVDPVTMQTDESGDATFADLEPGLYSLKLTEETWCKAVSDNVDAEGNVIIEAGARTTVYGFVCEGKPAS